jgi:hypothetical protein
VLRKFCSSDAWPPPPANQHPAATGEQIIGPPPHSHVTAATSTTAALNMKEATAAAGHCPPNYYITDRQLMPGSGDANVRALYRGGDQEAPQSSPSSSSTVYETIDSEYGYYSPCGHHRYSDDRRKAVIIRSAAPELAGAETHGRRLSRQVQTPEQLCAADSCQAAALDSCDRGRQLRMSRVMMTPPVWGNSSWDSSTSSNSRGRSSEIERSSSDGIGGCTESPPPNLGQLKASGNMDDSFPVSSSSCGTRRSIENYSISSPPPEVVQKSAGASAATTRRVQSFTTAARPPRLAGGRGQGLPSHPLPHLQFTLSLRTGGQSSSSPVTAL